MRIIHKLADLVVEVPLPCDVQASWLYLVGEIMWMWGGDSCLQQLEGHSIGVTEVLRRYRAITVKLEMLEPVVGTPLWINFLHNIFIP